MLDIFNNDAFSVTSLTDAMREVPHVPGLIGRMGIFGVKNISTLDVAIEKKADGTITLVQTSPRGGVGQTKGRNRRSMRKLTVPHLQRDDAIYADEVQGARMFGDEIAVETLMGKIAERAVEHSQDIAVTEEYHRLKVITAGQLLDADGDVIYDYMDEFGETLKAEIDMSFDTNSGGALRKLTTGIKRDMGKTLDGLPYTRIICICGNSFFDDLIANQEVREAHLNTAEAKKLLQAYIGNGADGQWGAYEFDDIMFINYRGAIGGTDLVHTDKGHFIPMGVPGLFRTVYAPADYIETVNRPGQRLYAKQWEMPNGKGVNLEFQSNPLHYCTRPRVLFRAKRT